MLEPGIVNSVKYKNGAIACDVTSLRGGDQYPDVPVMRGFGGFYEMPTQDARVMMGKLGKGSQRVIVGLMTTDTSREFPASMEGEELVIQVDADTKITLTKDGSGNYDVAVSASGQVYLGDENGTYEPVARKGDSVEVTDTDGNTLTGTITSGSSSVDST